MRKKLERSNRIKAQKHKVYFSCLDPDPGKQAGYCLELLRKKTAYSMQTVYSNA